LLYSLISGAKNYIAAENVAYLHMPHYEGLRTADILEFIKPYDEVWKCLPVDQEILKVPKQWLINVAYSGIGDDFSMWVKKQINARNAKVTKEKNMMVDIDPEVLAAFQASSHVSRK